MRVVRHVGGWCPRKAGAFNTQIDAQNGMQNALNAAIAGGGGTWINWRRSLTQGNSVNDDIVAVSVGTVLELSAAPAPPTTANGRVTVPAMPPYAPVNPGAGNRPLYPGDPNGVALGGPPLTVVVAPTQVHLRINPSNNSPGGFFIHSAWPL